MHKTILGFFAEVSRWFDGNTAGFAPLSLRLLIAYEFLEAGLEKLSGENWFADLTFLSRLTCCRLM